MTRRYINTAFIYAVLAMIFGVFYREFTKFSGFLGTTSLSVMHTHYFVLGMVFFLLAMVLEKQFGFSVHKKAKWFFVCYNIGINIMVSALFVRGTMEVLGTEITRAMNGAIAGVAGIGHIFLGLGIIWFFISLRSSAK